MRKKQRNYEKQVENRYNQGRGQGEKETYLPFITIRDFSSLGRTTRIQGWTTGRVHHLFSDLELAQFYVLEWTDTVIDIQEQYPLDIEKTKAIAKAMKVLHPRILTKKEDGKHIWTDVVMTTDFLVTLLMDGVKSHLAISVKYLSDLSKRTLEKLEIDKRYYLDLNINSILATEENIPLVLAYNVKNFHKKRDIFERLKYPNEKIVKIANVLTETTLLMPICSLSDVCLYCDDLLGLFVGDSLSVAYFLLATKRWRIDMNVVFHPNHKVDLLSTSYPFTSFTNA